MSSIPNIIDPDQLNTILSSLTDKTKLLFVSKSELRTQVSVLTEEINSLKARVEALENKENPEQPENPDENVFCNMNF